MVMMIEMMIAMRMNKMTRKKKNDDENNDIIKQLTNHLMKMNDFEVTERDILKTKTSIEKGSEDHRFFVSALNQCVNDINTLLNVVELSDEAKAIVRNLGGMINIMAAHIQGDDKMQFAVFNEDEDD